MEERDGLTRRDVLIRGAVVGGVAWTAPAIMSIGHSAGAAAGSDPPVPCGDDFPRITFDRGPNADDGICAEFVSTTGCDISEITYTWTLVNNPGGAYSIVGQGNACITLTRSGCPPTPAEDCIGPIDCGDWIPRIRVEVDNIRCDGGECSASNEATLFCSVYHVRGTQDGGCAPVAGEPFFACSEG